MRPFSLDRAAENIFQPRSRVLEAESVIRTTMNRDSREIHFATEVTRPANRRLCVWFAVCAFLIVFAGFARTFYLRQLFETVGLPLLLRLHGLLFTAWLVLFFVQARLVARHHVKLHRRLGIVGVVLAPLAGCVALAVAFRAGRRLFLTDPASLTSLRVRPLAMDFGTILMFLTLAITALCLRGRPEAHKRLILLASCSILLPAIARIPFLFEAVGLWGVVTITEVPPLACILYDSIKQRRLHPAFGWGGAALLSSFPAFMLLGSSNLWLRFVSWLVRL